MHSNRIRQRTFPRTIVGKILDSHTVLEDGSRGLISVDRIIAADTALPAIRMLEQGGYQVRTPSQAMLIPDHFTPSSGKTLQHVIDDERRHLVRDTIAKAKELGIQVLDLNDPRRGIQHVVSIEQAYAQPGVTIVAADSHTSTQGAVGALAFSIGTDLGHALATQCVWLKKPKAMRINLHGTLTPNVCSKDVIMAVIAQLGSAGATGFAVEFGGSFVRNLSVEGRMTLCNMSIEMGARLGIVSPDDTTFEYLNGRPFSPTGYEWDRAVEFWRTLPSDSDALFDREITFDVSQVQPMVSWGNNIENAVAISSMVPDPALERNLERKAQMIKSLEYMGLKPHTPLRNIEIDQVFIGSCANSTLEDLREAARLIRGRKIVIPTLIVPGSGLVKLQAETEGLDVIFRTAGALWGEAGCSMCSAMNGDAVPPGKRCASTTNRNHMGRQGRGSRTHLVSPITAAAAAVTGRLVDARTFGDF